MFTQSEGSPEHDSIKLKGPERTTEGGMREDSSLSAEEPELTRVTSAPALS